MKPSRKHVTTACTPCRDGKVKVQSNSTLSDDKEFQGLTELSVSATGYLQYARIAGRKAKIAAIDKSMTNASKRESMSLATGGAGC
jgi:hypothetical protein